MAAVPEAKFEAEAAEVTKAEAEQAAAAEAVVRRAVPAERLAAAWLPLQTAKIEEASLQAPRAACHRSLGHLKTRWAKPVVRHQSLGHLETPWVKAVVPAPHWLRALQNSCSPHRF